jgi:hypothetical protein
VSQEELTMPKTADKSIKVIINIQPGRGTEHQHQLWAKLWQRVMAEAKKELPPSQAPAKDGPTGGPGRLFP